MAGKIIDWVRPDGAYIELRRLDGHAPRYELALGWVNPANGQESRTVATVPGALLSIADVPDAVFDRVLAALHRLAPNMPEE